MDAVTALASKVLAELEHWRPQIEQGSLAQIVLTLRQADENSWRVSSTPLHDSSFTKRKIRR